MRPHVLVENDHLRWRLNELDREQTDAGDARRGREDTAAGRIVDAALIEDGLWALPRLRRVRDRIGCGGVDTDRAARRRHAGLIAGRLGVPGAAARTGLIDAAQVWLAVCGSRRGLDLRRLRRGHRAGKHAHDHEARGSHIDVPHLIVAGPSPVPAGGPKYSFFP